MGNNFYFLISLEDVHAMCNATIKHIHYIYMWIVFVCMCACMCEEYHTAQKERNKTMFQDVFYMLIGKI